jgi:peptide deformylase
MADEPATIDEQLDEEQEERLDPEVAARRQAALTFVRQWGDPVLKSTARPIDRFDDELRTQIEQMGRIMQDALGIGLAATQVGKLQRIVVYRVEPDSPVNAVVNPVIEWAGSELETMEEGCLSLQGVLVDIERPVHVRVSAQDEHGAPITIEASGLEARVLQHEIDHLDGVLILDRASREQRKAALRALREAAEQAA